MLIWLRLGMWVKRHRLVLRAASARAAAAMALAAVFVGLSAAGSPVPADSGGSPAPEIRGRSYILVDAETGQVLDSRHPSEPMPMASTTKIMTALLLIENMDMDETVWVPVEARNISGSKLYLEPGDRYTAADMVHALLISSANDAAIAVAVNVAGSLEGFTAMMNERAREIGMTDTSFANPHGLDHPDHYSTAADLALLSREAMANPIFRRFAGAARAEIGAGAVDEPRTINTHNIFVATHGRATGLKTGYTTGARFCLVGTAAAGGREVIGVILGGDSAESVAGDMARLVDWGLDSFETVEIVSPDEVIDLFSDETALEGDGAAPGTHRWGRPTESVNLVIPADGTPAPPVERAIEPPAPGDDASVATLVVTVAGEPYARVPLAAARVELPAARGSSSGEGEGTGAFPAPVRNGRWLGTLSAATLALGLVGRGIIKRRRRMRTRARFIRTLGGHRPPPR